jgi:replicative DNA helicase
MTASPRPARPRPPVDRRGLTCLNASPDGLPAGLDAERVLLGGILLDNSVYAECQGLTRDDFYLMAHRLLFGDMGTLLDAGTPVDLVTLANIIPRAELNSMGGVAWIASLTEGLPRRRPMTHGCYVDIIREKAQLRRIIALADDAAVKALDGAVPALEIGRGLMKELTVLFGRVK